MAASVGTFGVLQRGLGNQPILIILKNNQANIINMLKLMVRHFELLDIARKILMQHCYFNRDNEGKICVFWSNIIELSWLMPLTNMLTWRMSFIRITLVFGLL